MQVGSLPPSGISEKHCVVCPNHGQGQVVSFDKQDENSRPSPSDVADLERQVQISVFH